MCWSHGNTQCPNQLFSALRVACERVGVLSFLVSELGDDVDCTWPWNARVSFPEIELSVGTVHIASFAIQTLVANEQGALLSQVVQHFSSTATKGSSS